MEICSRRWTVNRAHRSRCISILGRVINHERGALPESAFVAFGGIYLGSVYTIVHIGGEWLEYKDQAEEAVSKSIGSRDFGGESETKDFSFLSFSQSAGPSDRVVTSRAMVRWKRSGSRG